MINSMLEAIIKKIEIIIKMEWLSRGRAEEMLKKLRANKFGKTRANGTKTRKAQNQENLEQILSRYIRGQQPSNEERRSVRNAMGKITGVYNKTERNRPHAQGKGQEHGSQFKSRKNLARYMTRALTSPNSLPSSRAGSRESSRSNSNHNTSRKARSKWPILKKEDYIWSIKVVPSSRSSLITKFWGTEGGKLSTSSDIITKGKAGRSPQQQAVFDAEHAFREKENEGYHEIQRIHRGLNTNLKSINNFVPFTK